jgi:NADP-dependent 3-hydroxy acid dehydrogenase YdfG
LPNATIAPHQSQQSAPRPRTGEGLGVRERLESADIANAIAYIVTRPRRMAVNEMLINIAIWSASVSSTIPSTWK